MLINSRFAMKTSSKTARFSAIVEYETFAVVPADGMSSVQEGNSRAILQDTGRLSIKVTFDISAE